MKVVLIAIFAGVLGASAATAGASATPATAEQARVQWAADGMRPAEVAGIDVAFMQPSAGPAFRRIWVKPVPVTFKKNWKRNAGTPAGSRIGASDIPEMGRKLGTVVRKEIQRELASAGFEIANAGGEGVLELDARVVELYLNAPDLETAAASQSFAQSFGEMTMVVELRDSATGEPLMRLLDRTEGWDHGEQMRATQTGNAAEMAMIANAMARALHRELSAK